jgi:ribosomal protein S18 acetylase RimI-like enzyme
VWIAELADVGQIGFIKVGPCKLPIEHREPMAGEVQQLYVLARYHNLRLGTRLMDVALEWLQAQQLTPLYVGVWSQNYGAQRFYARYGFIKVGKYGFPVGNTIDHEFILKR